MVVIVCSVLLQKSWLAKYSVTWNTWGDRQTGICQYLVMGISWSRDPQGFHHPTPLPAIFLISFYLTCSPLCCLCHCLLHPLLWLVVVCWVDGVGHRGRCHCLPDHHRHHHPLPTLPSRGAYDGEVQGRKRAWWRLLRHQHSTIAVLWKGRQASERMFSWFSLLTTSLKTVFFHKNGYSYKKNKNWRSSVHVQLKSMCTDNCQLMN
jgi:hypothetical protein